VCPDGHLPGSPMPRHDSFFKRLLRAFFPDLLRLALPGTIGQLDVQRAVFLEKELFTDSGRRREPDLLARIPVLSGSSESLLVHVEIETRARSQIVGRLRQYRRRIESAYDSDVVTILVTLRGGEPGLRVLPLPGVTMAPGLGSQYVAFGLSGCDAAAYLARPEPLAWALAALMNPGKLGRAELKTACLRRIRKARLTAEGRALLLECVTVYLELTPEEVSEYATSGTGGGKQAMRVADMSFEQLYRAEARKRERRAGKEQGIREVLLRLLTKRFGPLPDSVRQRVEEIDSVARLTRLAERVLTASSLEDLKLAPKRPDA
jgi:hypothetical protein